MFFHNANENLLMKFASTKSTHAYLHLYLQFKLMAGKQADSNIQ